VNPAGKAGEQTPRDYVGIGPRFRQNHERSDYEAGRIRHPRQASPANRWRVATATVRQSRGSPDRASSRTAGWSRSGSDSSAVRSPGSRRPVALDRYPARSQRPLAVHNRTAQCSKRLSGRGRAARQPAVGDRRLERSRSLADLRGQRNAFLVTHRPWHAMEDDLAKKKPAPMAGGGLGTSSRSTDRRVPID
jgi:hypothetical protein